MVADAIRAGGDHVLGFIDADPEKLGTVVEPGGAKIVHLEADWGIEIGGPLSLPAGADGIVVALGDGRRRLEIVLKLGDLGAPAVVHPAAVVSPSAEIGRGSVVFAGAVVNSAARIGRAVIINSAAVVEHDCEVADGAHVSPGAVLSGGVSLGARSWIGSGAIVIHRIRIGADVVVGAGGVVIDDLPDGAKVGGVPARPLGSGRA